MKLIQIYLIHMDIMWTSAFVPTTVNNCEYCLCALCVLFFLLFA